MAQTRREDVRFVILKTMGAATMTTSSNIHVVKLGGSLLEDDDLSFMLTRLSQWIAVKVSQSPTPRMLLVVGGGSAADVVRAFDRAHPMAEEQAHWLAIRAMQLNAHCVAAALSDHRPSLVASGDDATAAWIRGSLAIMEPWDWLQREDRAGVRIPHRWTFTSDSIAAHVAKQVGAPRITLLKSTLPPADCGLERAVQLKLVDEEFATTARDIPRIDIINLRGEPTPGGGGDRMFPNFSLRSSS